MKAMRACTMMGYGGQYCKVDQIEAVHGELVVKLESGVDTTHDKVNSNHN